MNSSKMLAFSLVFFCFLGIISTQAQTDKDLLSQLYTEEEKAINALLMYPDETRQLILNATQYPEALIKIESIQTRTSSSFRELLEPYLQATKQLIWDLTRYPDLIKKLVEAEARPSGSIAEVLANYPEVIHARAKQAMEANLILLRKVNELNSAAESAFETILNNYSPEAGRQLRELIELPEVLTILTDNIRLTVLTGDVYRNDPSWVIQKSDSMALELARENAAELEDWKESFSENESAAEELKASAQEFSEEYGYDDEYYDYEPERVVVRHYYHHYPYWFGYPTWYHAPRWRPYPYWYEWGFYNNYNGSVVIIGMPSFHYMHWYFGHPRRCGRWSYLSAHYVRHYHRHHRRPYGHRSSITSGVVDWRTRNNAVVSDNWIKDDGRLPGRFKKFSEMETAREKYNAKHPKRKVSQKEFIKKKKRKYPILNDSVRENERLEKIRKEPRNQIKPISKEPKTRMPRVTKQPKTSKFPVSKRPDKAKKPTVIKKTPRVKTKNPKTKSQPSRGQDYHKKTWEKSKSRKPSKSVKPPVFKKPTTSSKKRTVKPKSRKNTSKKRSKSNN